MASNWTKQRILFELRERGITAAELAARAGISRHTVYKGAETAYPKVNELIAEALDTPRHVIWPQFYDAKDRRIGVFSATRAA